MSVPVKVPCGGPLTLEGRFQVMRWHAVSRQKVACGDLLVTLEARDVIYEIEADVSGELEILAAEGKFVFVGDTVAILHAT